jgi:uncharacterized protein YndB with AHSA1/START domain
MTTAVEGARTLVIEKEYAHSPEKVWRALTDPSLLSQWLLQNDFAPSVGKAFQFRAQPVANWSGVIDCKVLEVNPHHRLSYTWSSMGLDTVVLFILTPGGEGTHLRVEQSGFGAGQDQAFNGARYGWQNFLGKLEPVLAGGAA